MSRKINKREIIYITGHPDHSLYTPQEPPDYSLGEVL